MLAAILNNAGGWISAGTAASRHGPIGLEFGLYRIRMVQLLKRPDGLYLGACASIPYTGGREQLLASPRQLAGLLRQLCKTYGFKGRDVVTCLQANVVRMLLLRYAVPAGQSDAEVIVQRMSERVEGELADYVLDYMPVRTDVREGQEHSALIALARREDVFEYLELLRKAGMNVLALEIGPVAIRRLVTAALDNYAEENLMVITMGQTQTYMTVLSGRRLIFDREVDFGERSLVERLCQELDMSESTAHQLLDARGLRADGEAGLQDLAVSDEVTTTVFEVLKPVFMELVGEINKALIYTASETRGKTVQQVYLTGAVACWNGIADILNGLLDIPVSVLNPMAGMQGSKNHDPDPRVGVATGLAMRGLVGDE
ncbi:MAG: pilus assembly protein PilM [Thiogranum sp.]